MYNKQIKDAKRLANRMAKIITDAKKCNLQFVVIDDNVSIGDIKIPATWDGLIGDDGANDFIYINETIIGIGA